MAVVLATAFFAHETIVPDYSEITDATTKWESSKAKRTTALNDIKEYSKGTALYDAYLVEKVATDKAYAVLLTEYRKAEFYGFKSFQQFLGEFGWALGLFLYSVFNLALSFIRKSQTFWGEAILHTTLITIAIFFIKWSFNRADFLVLEYIIYNILTAAMTVTATYFFVRYRERIFKQSQNALAHIKLLISFIFKVTPKKNKDEMWEVLNEVSEE